MSKLIERYKAMPSPTNRQRLQTYLQKHPMAICMATDEERTFLTIHEFQ